MYVVMTLLMGSRLYLVNFRLYDHDAAHRAESLASITPWIPHNEHMLRFRGGGTTPSPVGVVPFTIFEPFVPLTWFVAYEAGRHRLFPPRFIWKLAKAAIEGLACLHSSGYTLLGKLTQQTYANAPPMRFNEPVDLLVLKSLQAQT